MKYQYLTSSKRHGASGSAIVALGMILAFAPVTAHAEDTNSPADDGVISLDKLSVEGTKFAMPAYDVPASVSVVDRNEIEDINPSDLGDILERIPGAEMNGGPRRSGQSPSLRGLGGAGVLITLDGARQSFISGHDGRIFVDPEILSTVEVIRGASSALHGSGALGGVIALRTLDARDLIRPGETGVFSLKGGFDTVKDERYGTATAAYQSRDTKYGLVASGTYRNSGDISLGNDTTLPADDEITSLLIKGNAQITNDIKLTADWIRYRLDTVDPANPQENTIPDASNPLVDRKVSSDTGILRADINPLGNDWINGYVSVFGAFTEVAEDEVSSTSEVTRKVNSFGFSALNNAQVNDWFTLTFGAEAHRDKQTGTDNLTGDGSRGGVPDAEAQFYGAFIQGEIRIDDPAFPGELSIIPGVRIDRFVSDADGQSKTRDTAVSPKLGVRYEPVEWMMLFGNVARAFRAPNFNEIYADGDHFQIPLPGGTLANEFIINPDLKPETSTSYELGGGFNFDRIFEANDRFVVKASYWHAKVDDLINLNVNVNIPPGCFVPGPVPPCISGAASGNTSQYVNTDATLDGVEVELSYESSIVYAHFNFSSINGEEDYPVPTDPTGIAALYPNKARLDLGFYLMRSRALRFGTRVTVAADFTEGATPAEDRDNYETFDLYAIYEPLSGPLEGLRLDFAAENLADKAYEVVYAGVFEEGRNFKGAISYRMPF